MQLYMYICLHVHVHKYVCIVLIYVYSEHMCVCRCMCHTWTYMCVYRYVYAHTCVCTRVHLSSVCVPFPFQPWCCFCPRENFGVMHWSCEVSGRAVRLHSAPGGQLRYHHVLIMMPLSPKFLRITEQWLPGHDDTK